MVSSPVSILLTSGNRRRESTPLTRSALFLSVLIALCATGIAAAPPDPSRPQDPRAPVTLLAADPVSLTATPYMGWDTWYGLGDHFNEATIQAIVDDIALSGLKAAGYEYVWLDEGWWAGTRDGSGQITVSSTQWPHGMAYIATYIHNAGLKAGIYTDVGYAGCGGINQGSEGHY